MSELEEHLLDQWRRLEWMSHFFWHRLRSEWVLAEIKKNVGSAHPQILDIGAGVGVFPTHLRKAMPEASYAFSEIEPALRKKMSEAFGSSADYTELEWKSFGVGLLLDVLEHQKDDVEFLRSVKNRLGSHATLIV